MEKYKLIGLKEYSGTYNGFPYRFVRCYCTNEAATIGQACYTFNVKGGAVEQYQEFIGFEVKPEYDRFGKVIALEII